MDGHDAPSSSVMATDENSIAADALAPSIPHGTIAAAAAAAIAGASAAVENNATCREFF